ncbi:efflux RND transporter periplasmic adaptor subunit [Paraglaciecola chathamensis]|uniref:efflux RND transporter periplasmic adaptor subunit n=1 Tax=Paraglaciecola chathamensis TaxID=368405 RepID=UPI0026FFD479|nr:efflux RND transporter periplasmic adaptor subunit [Paraglaciecola chathamensis]MDO6559740.1 efflux RND transporter periplasmic adaptor subunit [Paraglaciecola chathamensis]
MKYAACIGALIFVSVLLSGCQKEAAQPQAPSATEVAFVTVTPTEHTMQTKMQGRVVASLTAEVRPQVGGVVHQRLFTEGNYVEQGDVLYQIEPATFQAAVNEAQANLNSAEASLETAKLKDQRFADLLEFEGVSQQDADDAHATYLEAKADIERFEAALETARINLEFTKVTAPISGQIGISTVTPGALVTASQATALSTIRTLDPIFVDMTKSSTEILKLRQLLAKSGIKKGSTDVSLVLEDGSEYELKGQLKMQEVAVDASTGAVTLRAEFANPDGLLLPGMFVRTQINDAVDENAILVPQQGIYHSAAGDAYAYVIDENNKVQSRGVTTLSAVDNQWLIGSGLNAGDKLLVEGSSKVRPGSDVKTVEVEMQKNGEMVRIDQQSGGGTAMQGGV